MRIKAAAVFEPDARLVERPSPTSAPTAFRIWKAGDNTTDHGPTVFSRKSADALLSEQSARGNLYSIDVDHLSLSSAAPPESRKAVGFHRLDVRTDENGEPELWAVDVQWTDVAKSGLEKNPPEWRYFSPAYDVDEKSREVVSYLNTALTNNPATWGVTMLASRAKGTVMDMKEILAALKAMAEGDDEEAKKCAAAMLAAADGDDDGDEPKEEPKKDAKDADGDDDGDEPKKDAEGEPDGDEKKDEPKKDSIAATTELAATVQALAGRVLELEGKIKTDERAKLLASRSDLAPELVKILADPKTPMSVVRATVKTLPVAAKKNPAAAATVSATRGEGQGEGRASRLPADEKRALDEAMGIVHKRDAIRREGNSVVYGVMTAEDARARAKVGAK